MTAEERIQMAFAKAYGDPNHQIAPVVTEMMHLAAAVRAAEDEALERAAVDAECCAVDADDCAAPLCAKAYRYIRDRIRYLKSSGGSR